MRNTSAVADRKSQQSQVAATCLYIDLLVGVPDDRRENLGDRPLHSIDFDPTVLDPIRRFVSKAGAHSVSC
jgi:hypothetical protein